MSLAPFQQRKADFATAYKELIEYLLWAIKTFQDLCECQWCWSLITSYITQHRTSRPGFCSPKEDCGKPLSPTQQQFDRGKAVPVGRVLTENKLFSMSPALKEWLLDALLLSTDGLNNNSKGWCSMFLPCLFFTCAHGIRRSFSHWQYLYSCPFFQSSII